LTREAAMDTEPAAPPSPSPTPETIAFAYEYGRDLLAQQAQNWRALDGRIAGLLGAAGVTVGLAAFARAPAGGSRVVDSLLTLAVIAYAVVAACACWHLRLRGYRGTMDPAHLWQNYWHEDV